ncbi:MAG: DUF3127 domain-containing protein [Bacteroidales bacterium]|nr:DUF3127 domain-containing protein [Bacteroidales bacterium]
MEITGKIILALPEASGTSKAGNPWKKREYVLETQENYPRKVFFDFFGERADQYPLNVGETVKLSFDIESREYQGRWFTSIRGWKAEKVDANAAAAAAAPAQAAPAVAPAQGGYAAPASQTPPPSLSPQAGEDDLPF